MKSQNAASTGSLSRSDARPVSRDAPVVFVVDDDISIRESLELLLTSVGWRVETFPTADDFLRHRRPDSPCCLILDLTLPGRDGLDLQQELVDRTELPIIFITGHGDVPTSVRAMKNGALEFLTKPFDEGVLLGAIRAALAWSRDAFDREAALRTVRTAYDSLSRRERQMMDLVVAGLLNKQVGVELGISEITVKAHRGQVMRKMQAGSLADLVRMAGRLAAPRTDHSGR